MDGICLRRNRGGKFENVAILAAIAVNEDSYREVLSADEDIKEAARKAEDNVEVTLTYCDCTYEHRTRIRTNHVIERLNREILRSTRVLCAFPDGDSALFSAAPRNRHTVGQHEYEALKGGAGKRFYSRPISFSRSLQTNLRITLDGTTQKYNQMGRQKRAD